MKKLILQSLALMILVGFIFGALLFTIEKEIKEVGLKNIVSEIWEGESE